MTNRAVVVLSHEALLRMLDQAGIAGLEDVHEGFILTIVNKPERARVEIHMIHPDAPLVPEGGEDIFFSEINCQPPPPDSRKDAEEILALWLQRPDLLDSREMFRRSYEVLSGPGVLRDSVIKNPEFFERAAPHLNVLLKEAKKGGHEARAIHLLYLTTMVGYYLPAPIVSKQWPTLMKGEHFDYLLGLFDQKSLSSF